MTQHIAFCIKQFSTVSGISNTESVANKTLSYNSSEEKVDPEEGNLQNRAILTRIKIRLSSLSPGYFALVMATGIVSVASHLAGFEIIAESLLYFNIAAYLTLVVLNILRIVYFKDHILSDFKDPRKSPGFLTFVAGTCILGSQFTLLWNDVFWSSVLYAIGLVFWFVLLYSFFTIITIERQKPVMQKSISGTWLLVVVSTQAISILGVQLAGNFLSNQDHILFLSLALFLCGAMFYLVVITFILYRMSFLRIAPDEFAPSYWINMGAVAITTLAGSLLISHGDSWSFLLSLEPFIKGFTLFFWAIGSWWIPFILILDIWRYVVIRLPLNYQVQMWDLVFPIGMYTVCTAEMSRALNLSFLNDIPSVFIYISLLAWSLTFIGMLRRIRLNFLRNS